MTKLTDHYGAVGPGWAAILTMLHEELAVIVPSYETAEVKEKFGGLRAYITVPQEEGIDPEGTAARNRAYDLEHRYEALSMKVCEKCGKAGENKPVGTWWLTLCAGHRQEAEAKRGEK